jgi:N-acetylated-alpha-linked acidic dipeptidase
VTGNHRDAWIYGAVDPSSGTAAMLESVHGIGALLKQGWRPRRTMIFASWDAEEEGLIGSTEWVEQHSAEMAHAVAYFNTDVAVSGQDFSASAVPSLKQFVRELTRDVPSPLGGTVYQQWRIGHPGETARNEQTGTPSAGGEQIRVGDLGSGSDFTPFFQHAGVPSTDIGSDGPYGVYHSVFDNYAWFTMNADPTFVYLQEMARVLGLEALRMAGCDVLPYDYVAYAREISAAIDAAKRKASAPQGRKSNDTPSQPWKGVISEVRASKLASQAPEAGVESLDFGPVQAAAARFAAAAQRVRGLQLAASGNVVPLNRALRQVETDLLSEAGLPHRPWYRHTIYAPGELTGYSAVVIPGVNEAIDARDVSRAAQQLTVLTEALTRATLTLESAK